jgi:RimJ/RimL family protein N-acetyltransferase
MIPTLETERLILRAFRQTDLDALAAMQSDPEVMRFLGATGAPRDRYDSWVGMAALMGQWALKGFGIWAWEERATGRFVGRGGLLEFEGWPEPELAYALDRPFWGQGFAREAGRAALDWGFATLGRDRFASFIKPANTASKRTAAGLGATFEGMTELLGTPCELWVHRRQPIAFA